jgi:hypothetical protein
VNPGCQRVREVMDSYLAEELLVETNHEVLRHLDTCQECAAELRRRQRLRALLSQALEVQVDDRRAAARISQALDREHRSWKRVTPLATAAAALIAVVAVAFWFSRPVDVAAYDDSAEDHVFCALAYPAGHSYDAERAAQSLEPPYTSIVEALGASHGVYEVIDAHMCPFKGRNYAHVVYRGAGQTLSLFAERADRGTLPAAPATTLNGGSVEVHGTMRQGYRIAAVATRDYQLFFVSERPTDPPEVEHDILRSAVRFIRSLEQ